MSYIKSNNGFNIGDWKTTTKVHESFAGKFTVGSRVQIIDIDPIRGYSIQDEHGNTVVEIGWIV